MSDEHPESIEGCLIFEMQEKQIPYMAYVEVAPHNRIRPKRYENVGGCLIAFAFKLNLIHGKGDYQGWLLFDVMEELEKDQGRLMEWYSRKYNAKKLKGTTMYIMDDDGHALIKQYLERKSDA